MTRSNRTRNRSYGRASPPSSDFRDLPGYQGQSSCRTMGSSRSRDNETLGTGSNREPFGVEAAVQPKVRRRLRKHSPARLSRTGGSMVSSLDLGSTRTPVLSLLPSAELIGDSGSISADKAGDPAGRNREDDALSDLPRGRTNSMDRSDASPSPRNRHHRSSSRKNVGYRTVRRTSRSSSLRPSSISGRSRVTKASSVSTLRSRFDRGRSTSSTASRPGDPDRITRNMDQQRFGRAVSGIRFDQSETLTEPIIDGVMHTPCLWCDGHGDEWVPPTSQGPRLDFKGITGISSFKAEVLHQDRHSNGLVLQPDPEINTHIRACRNHKPRLDAALLYAINNPEVGSKVVLKGRMLHITRLMVDGASGEEVGDEMELSVTDPVARRDDG